MMIFLGTRANWKETHFFRHRANLAVGVDVRSKDVPRKLIGRLVSSGESLREHLNVPAHMPLLLSSVMTDTRLEGIRIARYVKDVLVLEPDLVTTIEIPLYQEIKGDLLEHYAIRYLAQLEAFSAAGLTDRTIVFVFGRTREEIEMTVLYAISHGFTKFGIPCADILQREPATAGGRIHEALSVLKQHGVDSYVFGVSSPKLIEEFSYADHVVTHGWYHLTWKLKQRYHSNGVRPATVPPRLAAEQQVLRGTLKGGMTERMNILRANSQEAIDALLVKNKNLRKQRTLLEVDGWQKEAKDSERATARTRFVGHQESKITRR